MAGTQSTPRPGGGGRGPMAGKAAGAALVALVGFYAASLTEEALDRGEGNRLVAYQDSIGIWTICRGATRIHGRPVRRGDRLTQAECDEINDVESARHMAGALLAVPRLGEGCPDHCLHPRQIAAGGSLVYNIGVRRFRDSTVAARWNRGDWWGGCQAFQAYRLAGGRVIRGLVIRRAWEQDDYCFVGLTPPAAAR